MRWLKLCELVIGAVIALLWIKSALAHSGNPYAFLGSVYRYQLVGESTGVLIASVLPFLQLFLGCCLLSRVLVDGALALSGALAAVFVCVQSIALLRGLKMPCGCFGVSSIDEIGFESLGLASAMAILSLGAFVLRKAHGDSES